MRASFLLWLSLVWPATTVADETNQPILNAYFSVFETKMADQLPLAESATFFGSLLSEPIVGKKEVISFLNRVAPSVKLEQVKQSFEGDNGACAELVFVFQSQDVTLEEAHCIRIKDGKITSIRLYYDPRPLLEVSGD